MGIFLVMNYGLVLDFVCLTSKMNMATTPRNCHGVQGKTWSRVLQAIDKDSHDVCGLQETAM